MPKKLKTTKTTFNIKIGLSVTLPHPEKDYANFKPMVMIEALNVGLDEAVGLQEKARDILRVECVRLLKLAQRERVDTYVEQKKMF